MAQPPATNIHCCNNTSTANQPPQLLTNMAISNQPKLQPKKKKTPTDWIDCNQTHSIQFDSIRSEPQLHRPDPNKNRVSPSSTSMSMTNTPAADLTLMNLTYCSHADLHGFTVPSTKLYLASIVDSFVLSLIGWRSIWFVMIPFLGFVLNWELEFDLRCKERRKKIFGFDLRCKERERRLRLREELRI